MKEYGTAAQRKNLLDAAQLRKPYTAQPYTAQLMGVNSSQFTRELCKASNKKRLSNSKKKSSNKIRARRKGISDKIQETEGIMYKKGGF